MHFNSSLFFNLVLMVGILGNPVTCAYAQEITPDIKVRVENLAKNTEQLQSSDNFLALQRKIQQQQQAIFERASIRAENKESLPSFSFPSAASTNTWLFIFISHSMPEASIRNHIKAAKETGALLVLNGLIDNDLPKTLKTVSTWGEKDDPADNIIIDPILYERFSIQQVPTLVLTQAEYPCPGTTECATSSIDKIAGDIHLSFALREFARDGDLKEAAQKYLNLLGESSDE